jgi:hypothetical protein
MSSKTSLIPKPSINLTRKVLPSFYSFIWRNVILKYLSPKEALVLSRVCWPLRILIRDNMNSFWYYHLKISNNQILPVAYKHFKPLIVNCLSVTLCHKYNIPTAPKSSSDEDMLSYNTIHQRLLPQNIIQQNNIPTVIYGPHMTFPTNTLCTTNCYHQKHWSIVYPDIDEIDLSSFDKNTNYFFAYIDDYYERNKYSIMYKIDTLRNTKIYNTNQIASIKKQFVDIPRLEQSNANIDKELAAYDHIIERRKLDPPQNMNAFDFFIQEMQAANASLSVWDIRKVWRTKTAKEKLQYRGKVHTLKESAKANVKAFLSNRI